MRKLILGRGRVPRLVMMAALMMAITTSLATASSSVPTSSSPPASPSERLLAAWSEGQDDTSALLAEVLERHPEIERARLEAAMLETKAPQVRALDDPMLGVGLFVLPPETRVGPQRLSVTLTQKFPWFGKLALRQQAALLAASAARHQIEAVRLRVLAEARQLLHELAFVDARKAILGEEREHLIRHEEAARARYSAGIGLQQEVIKIQASITQAEQRLAALASRRLELTASLNALRDRPIEEPVGVPRLPAPEAQDFALDGLRQRARASRPEFARAQLAIERSKILTELAETQRKPDFQLGFGYTIVEGRRDEPGRLQPPPDNGDDILALSGSIQLPIRRQRIAASIQETLEHQRLAEVDQRQLEIQVDRTVGDLASRLPLLHQQWTLLQDILLAQAEEALHSAETAYATGELGALDLLDAEHMLFEVRTSAARVRADYAIARTRLEAALAGPVRAAEPAERRTP